jgi:hypothetical protein
LAPNFPDDLRNVTVRWRREDPADIALLEKQIA